MCMSRWDYKEENMEFVKVIDTTALSENTMMKVNAGGKEILLANVDGCLLCDCP